MAAEAGPSPEWVMATDCWVHSAPAAILRSLLLSLCYSPSATFPLLLFLCYFSSVYSVMGTSNTS